MPRYLYGKVVYTPEEEERRQFELDIDLKIIRAAKHGLPLTYDFYQRVREQVLGKRLNISFQYDFSKIFEPSINKMR